MDQHEGHGHYHGVSSQADQRYLSISLILILGFMSAEIVVGIIASSLALISDAGHMLTDAGALGYFHRAPEILHRFAEDPVRPVCPASQARRTCR